MSERDLRALDIRHTLPNLKNLLLTLSHDSSQIYQWASHSLSLASMLTLRQAYAPNVLSRLLDAGFGNTRGCRVFPDRERRANSQSFSYPHQPFCPGKYDTDCERGNYTHNCCPVRRISQGKIFPGIRSFYWFSSGTIPFNKPIIRQDTVWISLRGRSCSCWRFRMGHKQWFWNRNR